MTRHILLLFLDDHLITRGDRRRNRLRRRSPRVYAADAAKRGFYRAANSIFGKIGRVASEEVVLKLIKNKCVPVLLYGLEACALNKSQMVSLDFVVNRFFMKLFNTNNIDTVKACQEFFSFELPSVQLAKRVVKFESKVNTV